MTNGYRPVTIEGQLFAALMRMRCGCPVCRITAMVRGRKWRRPRRARFGGVMPL